MITVNLEECPLNEFVGKEDTNQRCEATFPLIGAHGTQQIATVYFEIEPGDTLGRHTDSAEELLVILEGELEASIGEETGTIRKGDIALVPKMVPHDMRNTGNVKARVLGVFGGSNNIVATFDKAWATVDSNVVSTAEMVA